MEGLVLGDGRLYGIAFWVGFGSFKSGSGTGVGSRAAVVSNCRWSLELTAEVAHGAPIEKRVGYSIG